MSRCLTVGWVCDNPYQSMHVLQRNNIQIPCGYDTLQSHEQGSGCVQTGDSGDTVLHSGSANDQVVTLRQAGSRWRVDD